MARAMALLTALSVAAALGACQVGSSEGAFGRASVPRPPELETPTRDINRPAEAPPVQERR